MNKCKLYHKLGSGLPLENSDMKALANIIREELKFLLRNNILPTPKNYERWFVVFCYAFENMNILPSDEKLISLYKKLHGEDGLSDANCDVDITLEILYKLTDDLSKLTRDYKEYARKKEKEISSIEERIPDGELTHLLSELLAHIRDIKAQNERFLKDVEEQHYIIEKLRERLEQAEVEANIDYLTNTFNRRSFERALRECFEEYKKRKTPFSLVFIDLDGFKKINDTYGHSVGDMVLARVAFFLRKSLRARDILARWGGDEFAVLMPNTTREQAICVAERLKRKLEDMQVIVKGQKLKLSFSYGVVEVNDRYTDVEELIREADELMYENKRSKVS